MFKHLIRFSIKNMNSETKIKQTLAKKLSGKRVPIKVEQNVESVNIDKLNKNKKLDAINLNVETIKKSKAKKLQVVQKDIIKNTTNETKVTRNTRKTKNETADSSLEVSKVKTQKVATKKAKKETSLEEEPCSNARKPKPEAVISSLEVSKVKTQRLATTTTKSKKETYFEEEPCSNTRKTKNEAVKTQKLATTTIKAKKETSFEEEPCSSKKIKEEPLLEKWEPDNWELILENIRSMRSNDKAPVDTMGCHKCADENADEKTQRFHKLVALMLSSQTKDETTYHAMLRLREHLLTPEIICDMKVNVLESILHPVSFYKNKAKYLQQTSKILVEKYNSDIPNNIKELVALPGVGPKMAHICMATAWQEITGIGVDVHVHRISNRLHWLPKPTKEPEQTRVALEAWLPHHLWSDVNYLLVGFGQTICTPVKPKCNECLNCQICPSAPKTVKMEKKQPNSKVFDLCDKNKFKKSKMHL